MQLATVRRGTLGWGETSGLSKKAFGVAALSTSQKAEEKRNI